MVKNFILFLQSKARGKHVLIFLIVYLIFPILIFPLSGEYQQNQSGSTAPPLDLAFGFSPGEAFNRIEAYGKTGRKLYAISAMTIDVAYPVIYSIFFSILILFLLKKTGLQTINLMNLALFPFCAALSDLFENAGIVGLLSSYPDKFKALAIFTSGANILKWSFVMVVVLIIFMLLFIWLYNALKKSFS
jgi:hypothetical protein